MKNIYNSQSVKEAQSSSNFSKSSVFMNVVACGKRRGLYHCHMYSSLTQICIEICVWNEIILFLWFLNEFVNQYYNSPPPIIPYPTAFPYGNGMVLHFYQQQESSTTKTVHKVINKGLKAYV